MRVFAQTRFEALHSWDNAEPPVEYLKHPHRHEFHVKAEVEVSHTDRDIEFIYLKHRLNQIAESLEVQDLSCEQYAMRICQQLVNDNPNRNVEVTVSEDGENGAIVNQSDLP